MNETTMYHLLKQNESQIKDSLKANALFDQDNSGIVDLLSGEMGAMLLKYNADSQTDKMSQSVSDCMICVARDELELLSAMDLKVDEPKKTSLDPKAPILLLASVLLCLLFFLLGDKLQTFGIICIACSILCAFLSGLFLRRPRKITAKILLNPEKLWRVLKKTSETMDRKMKDFTVKQEEWESEIRNESAPAPSGSLPLSKEELALSADLLEALYSDNGDFALKQLKKVKNHLQKKGIKLEDYNGDNSRLFEVLPTKRQAKTLRPALLTPDDDLLLMGRAAEKE